MPPQMKGLTLFIIDLRNSRDIEEENKRINLEINSIHTKFTGSGNLNGYQKRKYICKLIYMYLLGYTDVTDFALKESLVLLESKKYLDKQLGYLAVSILVDYNKSTYLSTKKFLNHVLEISHPYLVADLHSDNEDTNCLAIQFISSSFNVNRQNIELVLESDENAAKWQELTDIIYSFCTSPIKDALIKRKSSLALYILTKLYPDVILSNNNWIPRLLQLIDHEDIGVVISSTPLVQYLIDLKPQFVKSIIPAIANKLFAIIVDEKCPEAYYYYKSPAPWLVIKLLLMIENFFLNSHNDVPVLSLTDLDEKTLNSLRQVVARSIQNASKPVKGLPSRNSQSAILFQAVSLAVFLDASPDAINGAINALMSLLDSPETNTRYLALDALIKLTARLDANYLSTSSDKFDENIPIIFHLLYDKDISVKRKALDLLYTIANSQSYITILNKLLDFFPFADFTLKLELAIKIAILAERFATDSTWYVTTMLKLLSIGGGYNSNGIGYISNEVWERIVQIVVNNEDLQMKTCKLIINLLKKPFSVNVGGQQQPVNAGTSENLIKVASFVLGEFGHELNESKDYNLQSQFQLLYDAYFKVTLTTRAMLLTTFLKFVVNFPDEAFVPDIVDMFEIESQSIDLEIQTRSHEYLKMVTMQPSLAKLVIKPVPAFVKSENALMDRIGSVSHIVGRNRSRSVVAAKKLNTALKDSSNSLDESEDSDNPFVEKTATVLSPNWYAGYHRMLHYDAGIFYENQLVKITYRVIKANSNMTIKFVIINNSAKTAGTDMTGLTVLNLESLSNAEHPNYLLNLVQLPESSFHDKTSMEIGIRIRNVVENNESPVLSLTFMCGGSFNQLNLKFPVLLLKTLSSTTLGSVDEFKKRWLQIGDLLGTNQGEHSVKVSITHRHNSSNIVRMLSRIGFSVVHSTPDNMENGILVMGAGILHTQKSNYGVLTIIKSVDHVGKEFEIVVRCTGGGIPEVISLTLKEIFEGKA